MVESQASGPQPQNHGFLTSFPFRKTEGQFSAKQNPFSESSFQWINQAFSEKINSFKPSRCQRQDKKKCFCWNWAGGDKPNCSIESCWFWVSDTCYKIACVILIIYYMHQTHLSYVLSTLHIISYVYIYIHTIHIIIAPYKSGRTQPTSIQSNRSPGHAQHISSLLYLTQLPAHQRRPASSAMSANSRDAALVA